MHEGLGGGPRHVHRDIPIGEGSGPSRRGPDKVLDVRGRVRPSEGRGVSEKGGGRG